MSAWLQVAMQVAVVVVVLAAVHRPLGDADAAGPSALPRMSGRMVGSLRQGWTVLAVMAVLWFGADHGPALRCPGDRGSPRRRRADLPPGNGVGAVGGGTAVTGRTEREVGWSP